MKTNIAVLPVREKSKRETALGQELEGLVDVFRELREVERATGRTGLSARVRLSVSNILMCADRMAKEGTP